MTETKSFTISKNLVMQAYKLIKANGGAAGVDRQSIADFELNLQDNLYKLWNRMSSGSYFPPPVKAVSIPKKSGGERILGVPTVSDRIAQMVVKLIFEPSVEPCFLPDSYGYRPNKSALDAVGITRQRCWKYDWCLEFDIKGLFDNIEHELLMKAVRKHTDNKWVILYIERWLTTPMQLPDGSLQAKTRGTMQGGSISTLFSNIYLNEVDKMLEKAKEATCGDGYQHIEYARWADDIIIVIDEHPRWNWLEKAVYKRLQEELTKLKVEINIEKTPIRYLAVKKKNNTFIFFIDAFAFTFFDAACV